MSSLELGPNDGFRSTVALRVTELASEDELTALLDDIAWRAQADRDVIEQRARVLAAEFLDPGSPEAEWPGYVGEEALALLSVIDSWISLASEAVIDFYENVEPPQAGAAIFRRK